MSSSTPAPAGAASPAGDASAPVRVVALLIGFGLLVVLGAQLLIALDLVEPSDPLAFFNASHANGTLIVNAVAAGVIALAALALPARLRGLAVVPGLGLFVLTFGGAVTLGGHLEDVVAAVLVFATMWQLGRWVTTRMAPAPLQGIPVIDLVIGAGILGLLIELLGRLHVIEWWTAGLFVVVVGVIGLVAAGRAAVRNGTAIAQAVTASPLSAAAAGLIALQLGLAMVWLSAPDIMFDALYGKAYLPALWAHTGEIGPLVRNPALNLAGLAQVIATPGHSLGSEDVGRWLQDLSWVATVATLWWWGGKRSAVGPVAALALALTPHLMWQNSTAFDDNVLMLPAVAVTIAVIRTLQDDTRADDFRTALILGLVGGAAIWFKLHLAVLTLALLVGWILVAGDRRRLPLRASGIALAGVLVAAPALVLRWIDTGNPLFPSYNNIFKSQYAPPVNEKFNFPFWPDAGTWGPLKLPYEAIAHTSVLSEAAPNGTYGLMVPAIVVALLVGWRASDRRASLVAWGAIALALVFWWGQMRYLRYVVPIGVASSLLLVGQLRGWRPGRVATGIVVVCGAIGSIAFLPSTVATFWNVPGKQLPFAAAFGRWDKHDYLRTVFPESDALSRYQALAPKGADAVSDAHERLFLEDRTLSVMYEVATRVTLLPPAPTTGDEAYAKLRRLGITWAIVQTNGTSETYYPWLRLAVTDHGQAVFADRNWTLFHLVDRPRRPGRSQSCDVGFRHRSACWSGPLDDKPGLTGPEVGSRSVVGCPGGIVGVRVTAAPGGAPSLVSVDPDGTTGLLGYTTGLVQPGTTGWVYGTMPPGSSNASISITPGQGGSVTRAVTGLDRSGCRSSTG
jgi:hypothetical protein